MTFARIVLAGAVVSSFAWAGEGKWTPQQVLDLGPSWVKQQGFGLPLSKLWDPKTQGGLLTNAVQFPGCSGSFVSKDGLLITNHHCIVGILQEHSTPQQNLVKDGYLAKSPADEKPAKAFRLQVPRRFIDVTKQVREAIPANADDFTRFKSVEAMQKKLVAECEKVPGTRCTFASFDGGLFFTLTEFTELTDVRLVYAPPGAVGDFGGEVDNWMWPRHSGDFALVRAYAGGKPFSPAVFFPFSESGVKEGDAVAVLGYPGLSFRSLLAEEMAERQNRWFPSVQSLATEWVSIIEEEAKRSPESAIATADDVRGLLNAKKNSQGQLAGLARGHIVEKQLASDARVRSFAEKKKLSAAIEAHAGLVELMAERSQTWDRDFLFDMIERGPRALRWPLLIVRRSVEAERPDSEREPGYQERDIPRLRERHERDQKRYAQQVDGRLLVSWLKRALALPPTQRSAAVDSLFGSAKDDAELSRRAAQLVNSKVMTLEQRQQMFDETPAQLQARKDPLLNFAIALDVERRALRDRRESFSGRVLKLRPVWREAVMEEAGAPLAPDANSTLRVTFGRVRGYSPKDAVVMKPFTTLTGVMAKHTGEEPFDVPPRIREAFAAGKHAQVPVDFLADCDTTGGNSGSPVIDGQGRLVGVNFDRVWENVANDFGYNPDVARNVVADVRYLLWLLSTVEGANAELLLKELTGKPLPKIGR